MSRRNTYDTDHYNTAAGGWRLLSSGEPEKISLRKGHLVHFLTGKSQPVKVTQATHICMKRPRKLYGSVDTVSQEDWWCAGPQGDGQRNPGESCVGGELFAQANIKQKRAVGWTPGRCRMKENRGTMRKSTPLLLLISPPSGPRDTDGDRWSEAGCVGEGGAKRRKSLSFPGRSVILFQVSHYILHYKKQL